MKKIVSMVLIVVMLLSMGCVTAFAEGEKVPTVGPMPGDNIGKSGMAMIVLNNYAEMKSIRIAENKGGAVGMAVYNDALEGVTYDLNTNTLTLKNAKYPDCQIAAFSMGDDFKLKVEGNCSAASISIQSGSYSSSLNIVGSGTLTVNETKKHTVNPILVTSYYETSTAKLSIADTVTLHVYSTEIEEETSFSSRLMVLSGTGYDTADKAFTADGKAIDGVKSERMKETKYDRAYVAMENNGEVYYDNKVVSKSDPDGIYCAYEIAVSDEVDEHLEYVVRRFFLVPGTDKYTEDKSFSDYGKNYTAEEFNKEFTFVKEDKPVTLNVTSEWREENFKGENDVKLKKLDDPDGVYAGDPWGTFDPYSYENPESYNIRRVKWDDNQGVYVQDEDFEPFYCDTADLEAEGYQVETEEVTRNKQVLCWEKPAPFDEDNNYRYYDYVNKASAPDVLYAVTATFTSQVNGSEDIEKGCYITEIKYNEDADAYYLDPDEELRLTDEEMKEQGYSIVTETVVQPVEIKYIPAYYDVDDYGMYVTRLKKDGDDNYCCSNWYEGDDEGVYYHNVYKMTYNEDEDVYYVDSDEYNEVPIERNLSDEDLLKKYSYVTEPQNVNLEFNGYIECYDFPLYLDDSGKKYVVREEWVDYDQWINHIYELDESKSFKNGDETYCFVEERPDLSIDDVKSTEREVELDSWIYWLEGDEYHHIGTGTEPVQTGVKVSGTITSYVDDSDVTVKLTGTDNNFTAEAKGKDDYSIADVPAGKYTLSVSKNNHVTREYTVTVADADVTQDVKICPKGDVNADGKTNAQDCTAILRYVRKIDTGLSDYQLKCADVTGDVKTNVQDVTRILRHVRKIEALY